MQCVRLGGGFHACQPRLCRGVVLTISERFAMRKLPQTLVLILVVLFSAVVADAGEYEVRKWLDATGKHSMEASYVSVDDNKVTLKDPKGQEFEIELDQLSRADRRYISLISKDAPKPSNGFPSPSQQPNVIGQSQKRGVELEVHPPVDEWSFNPRADSGLEFAPREFSIPLEFAERATHFVVTPSGRFGAITTSSSIRQTRVSIVDLQRKRVIARSAANGRYLAIAVSDDGQRVAIRSDSFGDRSQVGVFRVNGKKLEPEGNFKPFLDRPDPNILWAGFVGDNQLAVLCKDAGITVRNLSTFEEDYYFELDGDAAAIRNMDGTVIAFVDRQNVGLFHVGDQTFQAGQPVPSGLWTKHVAFSPSEKRLVAFAVNRIVT